MFSHNKTDQWLMKKSKAEKSKVFAEARAAVNTVKSGFKKRQQEIQEQRRKAIEEKMREMAKMHGRRESYLHI